MFIETHAHLYDEKLFDRCNEILELAKENDVKYVICPSIDKKTCEQSLFLSNKYQNVFCALGVHPECVNDYDGQVEEYISKNINNKKVVAIGEIGLDYYWENENKDLQINVFKKQIELAIRYDKPIIVHMREATQDTIDILKCYKNKIKVVMHCYSGSLETTNIFLNLGCFFSFGGVITFNNANKVIEAIKNIPMDRIMLETDSPYMSPVPHRGEINEPKNIPLIAEKIAQIKGITIEEVKKITTKNALRFFKIGE